MEQPRLKVETVPTSALIPYANNAKIHTHKQVEEIAASIEQFGFSDPVGVWTRPDGQLEIVEGHGRVLAAERLGLERVPVVKLDHLDDDARRAYTHVHNQLTLESGFDWEKLNADMGELSEFDWEEFGLSSPDWFERENRWDESREDGNDEYNAFLDKFEQPKTTDDCYTPDNVYEAVAAFVENTYHVNRFRMVRPFYPGGDYQAEKYAADAVVVDNPPFSIMAEILRFYQANGIDYFLFCPGMTAFNSAAGEAACFIPICVGITYENRACVPTSFITSLEPLRIHTYPILYKAIESANSENEASMKKALPKYSYPPEVVTAASLGYLAKYGQEIKITKAESKRITELDAMKDAGKSIYGGGYLISEKAAAEKAAAEKAAAEKAAATLWPLSERELEIVRSLAQE